MLWARCDTRSILKENKQYVNSLMQCLKNIYIKQLVVYGME